MQDLHIVHDAAHHRFAAEVDGYVAYVEYVPGTSAIAITHTVVPPAIGGRGIGGDLVRVALMHARNEGLQVDPVCSFADAWMRKHPEFDALRC